MSGAIKASRSQLWLESLGDWAWPGRTGRAEALLGPPAGIAAPPPRLEPAVASSEHAGSAPYRERLTPRALLLVALLGALAAVCCALALKGHIALDRIIGTPAASQPVAAVTSGVAATAAASLPALVPVSHDSAGSAIDRDRARPDHRHTGRQPTGGCRHVRRRRDRSSVAACARPSQP